MNTNRLTSPILLTALATVLTTIGSEVFAKGTMGELTLKPNSIFAGIAFTIAGILLFYRAFAVDRARDELRKRIEEEERRFLWEMHNPEINPQVVKDDYEGMATEEQIQKWRNERIVVVPEQVFSSIERRCCTDVLKRQRKSAKWFALLAFFFTIAGILLSFWPEFMACLTKSGTR